MRRELRDTLTLAWPVILAEMAWVVMGIVDTVMVGPLGPAAIGAVGTGSSIFFAFMVFGMGTLFALDTFVAQNHGAGRHAECHRWLFAGFQLAVVMSVVLVLIGLGVAALLPVAGIHPDVLRLLQPYLRTLLWSAPLLLFFTVCRRYLQAIGAVRPIIVAAIVANLINAGANWVFIYGHFGIPAQGAVGSAYATTVARVCLVIMLWTIVVIVDRQRSGGLSDVPFVLDWPRMSQLARLGIPAAAQIVLEVGVFTAAAALAGRISPVALAANQVVLNIASFFFMLPHGLSSAAAVRVGHAIGRADVDAARRAGWAALALALGIGIGNATLFVLLPTTLLRLFTSDTSILDTGVTLLFICALFQPFDAFQSVATGALRGLGDTRTPALFNLVGHWLIGLPLAYVLCFNRGWGVAGLWTGLGFSLTLVGIAMLVAWRRRTGRALMAAAVV